MSTDRRKRQPRIVSLDWVEQSWREKTLLDEERENSALSSLTTKMLQSFS